MAGDPPRPSGGDPPNPPESGGPARRPGRRSLRLRRRGTRRGGRPRPPPRARSHPGGVALRPEPHLEPRGGGRRPGPQRRQGGPGPGPARQHGAPGGDDAGRWVVEHGREAEPDRRHAGIGGGGGVPGSGGDDHRRHPGGTGPRARLVAHRVVRLAARVRDRVGRLGGNSRRLGIAAGGHRGDGDAGPAGRRRHRRRRRRPGGDRTIRETGGRTMKTEGRTGELHWTDTGGDAGRTVLLVHSLGTDSSLWARQVEPFSQVRRVITVDLPGHGSSTARDTEYTIEDLGADVLAVADAAGVERFDYCGISIGGQIGLWLAVEAPERVETLVAACTAARIGTSERWQQRIEAVEEVGMEGLLTTVVAGWFSPSFGDRDPDSLRSIQQVFTSVDPVGYTGCCA